MVRKSYLYKYLGFLALTILLTLSRVGASPLFPDVADDHWASDAVANLAARGLIEGYPDGSFKGDRAATRWEVAMMVARALQRFEQTSDTFATQKDRETLLELAQGLKFELEALGVRVTDLEQRVELLDRRVTELERITFYGSVESRVTMQSFQNRGADDNSSRQGGGLAGTVPYLNYANLVGTSGATPLRPQTHGLIPVVDYRVGRALTNGTGFSSRATLGLNIEVSPTFRSGVEFVAFSSGGNDMVDAYWGVRPPFLSSPTTALGPNDQNLGNTPFTKMVLDRVWLEHTPSKTRLNLGTIDSTTIDSFVYQGQPNIGVYGPRIYAGSGFQLLGRVPFSEETGLSYEVLGTRFGHGIRFEGITYLPEVLSGKLAYEFDQGKLQANFSRMQEAAPSGGYPLGTGFMSGTNVGFGDSTGWNPRQWVNPPGHYIGELQSSAGFGVPGSTADTRAIPGWNPNQDDAVGFGPGAGGYGPQAQTTFGLSANYNVSFGEDDDLALTAEFGRSRFEPNRNSAYSSQGDLLRLALDGQFLNRNLDVGLEYLSVDPNYNPASWASNVTGMRFPTNYNFTGLFHLHDYNRYPHNRRGWRGNLSYRFADDRARVWVKGSVLEQTRTSLYDVRVTQNALGVGTPTGPVIGFAPGFIDPVFAGYAHPAIYGAASQSSFDANLAPFEDPRGRQRDLQLGASYSWPNDGLKLSASFERATFARDSALSAMLGGSQNRVDIKTDWLAFSGSFPLTESWRGSAGFDLIHTRGHHDPAGLFNFTALTTGSTDFANIDSRQFIPHLASDWKVSDNTDLNVTLRYYDTTDRVPAGVMAGDPSIGQVGSSAHPFSWRGLQVSSHFQFRF